MIQPDIVLVYSKKARTCKTVMKVLPKWMRDPWKRHVGIWRPWHKLRYLDTIWKNQQWSPAQCNEAYVLEYLKIYIISEDEALLRWPDILIETFHCSDTLWYLSDVMPKSWRTKPTNFETWFRSRPALNQPTKQNGRKPWTDKPDLSTKIWNKGLYYRLKEMSAWNSLIQRNSSAEKSLCDTVFQPERQLIQLTLWNFASFSLEADMKPMLCRREFTDEILLPGQQYFLAGKT